jgi:hypothetical protein
MNNIPSETSVDSKEQSDSVSNSNISVTTEDGFWVFKKRQESAEEVIFYNTDYFKRIGFPDAEVSIGKVTPDGIMKGGYYKHPEKLTYPFRQFVYLFQREKEKPVKEEASEPNEPNEHNPNFLERLVNYGVQISNGVQSGIDSLSYPPPPKNLTEEEKRKQEEDEKEQALRNDAEENSKKGDFDQDNYWIVRIPIINDDSLIPKNKYEKEEENQKFQRLENLVEKSLLKSKVGRVYEVGSRIIRMCESVKEYEELKIEESPLPGSRMSKWHRFTYPE